MSKSTTAPQQSGNRRGPFNVRREWIEEHREEIEAEAESDAPDAWVFEELLQWLEEVES